MSTTSNITVEAGLHVLRYIAVKGNAPASTVMVAVSAVSQDRIELISAPGAVSGCLDGPGDCLVVRAEAGGTLDVFVGGRHGQAGEAELRLDRLDGTVRRSAGIEGLETELVGHVSRRGDVRAPAEGWVAGPDAPAPIEGVLLRLHGAEGVGLEYQVQPSGHDGQWSAWTAAGAYAGTRGQHRPLRAVRVRLAGPAAGGFRVRGAGLFLGSPVQAVEGQEIELKSASGGDPLVGLKIAIIPRQSPANSGEEARPSYEARSSGRVRVFRASHSR